jgi:hypothetical protein
MSRFRVVLGGISAAFAVFAAFAVLLLVAPAASADPVDDATSTLQSSSLYVAPGAEGRVDNRSAVQNAFGSSVKAAIFPSTVNGPDAVNRLHAAISPQQTLVVFDGNQYQAKSGVYCQGFAQTQMDKAYSDTRANLQATNGDLTNTLVEFANNLKGGPVCANGSGTGSTDTASGESGGGAAVWPWLVGLGVLGAGGVGGVVFYRKRKLKRQLEAAKANVMPYYDRLANEVNTLDPKDNATARQAVADASERFNSAGSQLDTADSVEKYAAARRTTLEGLYAAVTARKALGLDPGPELPPIGEPRGDQLTKAQDVTVQGQTYQGYPDYTRARRTTGGGRYARRLVLVPVLGDAAHRQRHLGAGSAGVVADARGRRPGGCRRYRRDGRLVGRRHWGSQYGRRLGRRRWRRRLGRWRRRLGRRRRWRRRRLVSAR